MSKLHGTYLIEFYNGKQIVCGNNYKPWYVHTYEYARWKYRDQTDVDLSKLVASVSFSDTPFVDDGGLKYATPEAYQEIIDDMTERDGKHRTSFNDIAFQVSDIDKNKLNKRLVYELS
jgi:hypothetical protein